MIDVADISLRSTQPRLIRIVDLDAPEAPSSQTMAGQRCQEVTHGYWG
jgi:hypothetical protein